jgi:hypothetical protein
LRSCLTHCSRCKRAIRRLDVACVFCGEPVAEQSVTDRERTSRVRASALALAAASGVAGATAMVVFACRSSSPDAQCLPTEEEAPHFLDALTCDPDAEIFSPFFESGTILGGPFVAVSASDCTGCCFGADVVYASCLGDEFHECLCYIPISDCSAGDGGDFDGPEDGKTIESGNGAPESAVDVVDADDRGGEG